MKTPLTVLGFAFASALSAQAFTIDFNALVVPANTTVTSGTPLTINVAGYGNVRFETSDNLIVSNNHQNDSGTFTYSLELDPGESVLVTFLGPDAINVNFDIIGISGGESINASRHPINTQEYTLNAIGGDGGGIAAVSWDSVPEPSSSMLVTLGAGVLLLRRKRG